MNLIIIGGIPASGKTTLGKKLGKKYKCLSLELESLRWEYFDENIKQNFFTYTNNSPLKENETKREYYLRMSIYQKKISNLTFIKWNIETIKYINKRLNKIYQELVEIKNTSDIKKLKKFIKTNKNIINYIPQKINLDILKNLVISHALISKMDIIKHANRYINLDVDMFICMDRFKSREKIKTKKYDKQILEYLQGYKECIMNIKTNDIRIKNDEYNFHFRVVAIIEQNNKFLIQRIEGYDYYILPGGHVNLGEDSITAIKREVKEEVGCDIKNSKLICFHENFYLNKGRQEHWIENYFLVKPKNKLSKENWTVIEKDGEEEKTLHFYWMSKEEIKEINLKPTSIKDLIISDKISNFNYLINGR